MDKLYIVLINIFVITMLLIFIFKLPIKWMSYSYVLTIIVVDSVLLAHNIEHFTFRRIHLPL